MPSLYRTGAPVIDTSEQRAAYAAAIEQAKAICALEGLKPSSQDSAIDKAILAGRVSPEQAGEELLAYVAEHKTMAGFIESRVWATA